MEPIRRLTLADEQATVRLGQLLADIGHYGDILALWGGLGCGKTVFARAFIRTLTDPKTEVPSPTFTLVQSYGPVARLGCFIHHFDLFRLAHPDEAYELAIEDAFSDGIALIEWPDRLGSLLPSTRLDIHFIPERAGMGRCALLCGGADWRHRLYEANLG